MTADSVQNAGTPAVIDRSYSYRSNRNVYIQEARFTTNGLEGHWCQHRIAAPRCDESRLHGVGTDRGRQDTEAARVCRISPRRDHGSMVAEADRHRLRDVVNSRAIDAVP